MARPVVIRVTAVPSKGREQRATEEACVNLYKALFPVLAPLLAFTGDQREVNPLPRSFMTVFPKFPPGHA